MRASESDDLVQVMTGRVHLDGKHLQLNGERFVVKGVTYGSFVPRADGARFPEAGRLVADLEAMAALGLNTVRTYDVPPAELIDLAGELGLRLLVGLDYEDWRYHPKPGRRTNRSVVAAGIDAVERLFDRLDSTEVLLAVSVGNEVPGDLVRVHGQQAVEHTLSAVMSRVHELDADVLTTYTNYPTTEYLRPDGQDIITYNVFLEETQPFDRYLGHLQVVSGAKPLILTELGLASEVHGHDQQATLVAEQLGAVHRSGCAGATVFAWTDEWGVNGQPVSGWGFGITTEQRVPKPVAREVEAWAGAELKDAQTDWPRISAVVCAYNEQTTIEECLRSLERCDYPDLEVLVCNDGSTDATLELARRFPFTVLDLPRGGLSRARNAGIENATGEIVAFLDADAMCHPQWPWFLALAFDRPEVVAAGGPNLPVPSAGLVERAVALSPGAPTEVLSGDDRAEHIAGCNMAFRRDVIRSIGAFDATYTAAGDDVDVCWKLLDAGHQIAFNPSAQVTHHRRATVKGYLKQQRGYGRAEKLLSAAHPARFNRLGQARWSGFIYGGVGLLPSLFRPVVYHGHQGSAPFQPVSIDRASAAQSWATALLPLVVLGGVASAAAGAILNPWFVVPALLAALLVVGFAASVALSLRVDRREPSPLSLRLLVAMMHVAQPLVRSWGRLKTCRPATAPAAPGSDVAARGRTWSGDRLQWLAEMETSLRSQRFAVVGHGPTSPWDVEIRLGPLLRLVVSTAVAWQWTPHLRTALKSRLGLSLTASVAAVALWLVPVIGFAVVGGLVAELAHELFRARRARRLLAISVAAAGTAESAADVV